MGSAINLVPEWTLAQIFNFDEPNDFLRTFAAGAFPIWQGATNGDCTQITLLLDNKVPYALQVLSSKGKVISHEVLRNEISYSRDGRVVKIKVSGLNLAETYHLQVIDPGSGAVIDDRIFQCLDVNRESLRWAFASCGNDLHRAESEIIWGVLSQQLPDIVMFVGDTVYSDNKTDGRGDHSGGWENYWERYQTTFKRILFYRLKKLTPILATWDDHDFGVNNGDSSFKEKRITSFLFELFWGNTSIPGFKKGPGITTLVEISGQRFFLMDNRSFRTPKGEGRLLHWGSPVETFLYEELRRSETPACILSGSQIFGGYLPKGASFEANHPQNLRTVLAELSKIEAPIYFGSGDVHFSEVMNLEAALLGYPSFEFTSSSIHSYTFPGQHLRGRNKRRVKATSAHNFLMMTTHAQESGLSIECRCIDKYGDSKINFEGTLKRE